jgi:hypothetical protein
MPHTKMVSHRWHAREPAVRLCLVVFLLFTSLAPVTPASARAGGGGGIQGYDFSDRGGRRSAIQRYLEAWDGWGKPDEPDGDGSTLKGVAAEVDGYCTMDPWLCYGGSGIEIASQRVEREFSVSIDNQSGLWTFTALASIENAMTALQEAIGPTAFNKLYGGLTFSIGGCRLPVQMCSNTGVIRIGEGVMDNPDYIEFNTLHELGHMWDFRCGGCMSRGMENVDQSFERVDPDPSGRVAAVTYHSGGMPPDRYAAAGNRCEDWAESFAAGLRPSLVARLYPPQYVYGMDDSRQNWVAVSLFGIAYEGLH